MIYSQVAWVRLAVGLAAPNWTIPTAITGEAGGLILGEGGAPLILEGPQVGGTPGQPTPLPPPSPPPSGQDGQLDFNTPNQSGWINEVPI